jgi:hypothetical protein
MMRLLEEWDDYAWSRGFADMLYELRTTAGEVIYPPVQIGFLRK